MKAIFFE